jgi:protein-tyrosine-phosphatase
MLDKVRNIIHEEAVIHMAELKIKIPEDLKRKMDEFGVDWSPAIRRMIEREIQNLTEIERIISKSRMAEEDALELGEKVSKSIAERFRKHVAGDRC